MTSIRSRRNESRRGQINQVFILIVAVIVIVATIALSVRLLGFFQDTSCTAADAGFQDDLSEALDSGSVYGSRDEIAILAPCDAQELILIDAKLLETAVTGSPTGYPTIDAALVAGVKSNAFVIVDGIAQDAGFDARIIIGRAPNALILSDPVLKVPSRSGRFIILTEGYGRFVRVEAP